MKIILLLFLCCLAGFGQGMPYRIIKDHTTSSRVQLSLEYTGSDSYYGNPKSPIIKHPRFILQVQTFSEFYFKIIDTQNQRFEVPTKYPFPNDPRASFSFPLSASGILVKWNAEPFDFQILRKGTNTTIFSTYGREMVFSDYYIQLGTEVASDYIYGIGERFQESFRRKDGKWTNFNRDHWHTIDRGNGFQTYGYYPFYLLQEGSNASHINYFRSSNAMDTIKSTENGRHFLTWKIIGGVIDFKFYLGSNPMELIRSLHEHTGRSIIPPFWSLGFHQSRWGYKNITYLETMVNKYKENGLPLDTIWSDIDYLKDMEVFSYDFDKFPLERMQALLQDHTYCLIIDAGIQMRGPVYEEGVRRDVFVKDATGEKPFVGQVWPGGTHFVDYFQPNASQYWGDMLSTLYEKIKFTGVWLDMNEVDNFCSGPCYPPQEVSVFDYSNDLPYHPGNDSIETVTISLNSTHHGGLREADAHVYHAMLQAQATHKFMKQHHELPFILTRASTFGSSQFAFHWTGDNVASWEYLKGSIIDHFNNQFFGFQMIGSEICGFRDNTTEQLCARWFQLGSLYPFARSHNDNESISQEPYALGETVLASARNNLKQRYSLLKHYYTVFMLSEGITPILRPLFLDYPQDDECWEDEMAETQLLIGSNLMSAPILTQGMNTRWAYFPGEDGWFDLYSSQYIPPGLHLMYDVGLTKQVPVFIKANTLILRQWDESFKSTRQLNNHMQLSVTFVGVNPVAYGSTLSLANYSDEAKVSRCIDSNYKCLYNIKAELNQKDGSKGIDVTVTADIADESLKQSVYIDAFTVYLVHNQQYKLLDTPIDIRTTHNFRLELPYQSEKSPGQLTTEQK